MTDIHFLDPNPAGHPAVLLLHGLGADGSSWTLQMLPLSQAGFRPLAVDIPGFGASRYDGRGWSLPRVAAQLASLLEELGTGPAHVVGLSMGGVIAQQFALDFPHLTRHLVLVSTFARLRPQNLSQFFYFLQRILLVHLVGLPAQAEVVARRVFPHPEEEELRRQVVLRITQADPRAYRAAMRSLGLFNSLPRLRQIKSPVLVISGEKDTTVRPEAQRQLAESIPHARQVIIPGGGHAIAIDRYEAFNQILLEFLTTANVSESA
jgi:pimeloyl-ACP methyl ester carboxylesterase